ncbi:hypothetical protein MCOR25_005911 [Pyricularia grisea]|uniref:C2H2-type domain-containing protein n=1 Tax=Pyricularia grisea TaxID=148305 RepID=A0A6P8B0Y9_PYRGI|nr:uncharacterized protein PgNI_07682 [Pyricularia grisea]KAI6363419.1 hypothetical protein MCOR25_005911 [Pyricularia grisea]TLD08565.1 hypothetical protein PgNI_07682 [Pyricularia grisea]
MAHHSYQDFRWLSPTTASQPTWDSRSGQAAAAASLSRTQPGAMADPIDSYEDFSGDNGEGENITAGRTRQRRSSTGPWASGNSISSNGDGTTAELWACPFCKWKPLRYQGCHTYKLKEISRVKQHLRRKHRIPLHCDVCSEEFADDEARLAHVRAQSCSLSQNCVQKTWEGVTPEQQELLERRAERNKTKVEQWYSIYEILFPGQTPPASPYVDLELSPQMHSFQAFLASDQAATILNEATIAQVPPHLQYEEILAISRGIFEQAMPALLQQYESSQQRRLSPRKPAERGEEEDGQLSRVSSDTWMSVPPLIRRAGPVGLEEFGSGPMETDDNDLSTVSSPVTSVRVVAEQHHGSEQQQQRRALGINTMVAAAAASAPPHQIPRQQMQQQQHHHQQQRQQQRTDQDPTTPLHQQAGLWGLQHQSPLSPAFCGAWVNETTTSQQEDVSSLGNPDMLYYNFDAYVPPYYGGQQ